MEKGYRTSHIYHMPHTQFFSSCARLKMIEAFCCMQSVFLKSHSTSSMFHRTLFDPQLSPHFSTPCPTLALVASASPSLSYPSMSLSTATLQKGFCFGRLAEQSPLIQRKPFFYSRSTWEVRQRRVTPSWAPPTYWKNRQE